MRLPLPARSRWSLEDGGVIGFVDLGEAIIISPGDPQVLRRWLLEALAMRDADETRRRPGNDQPAEE